MRRPYTHLTNPMPAPLSAAMSSLLRQGARAGDSYADEGGHHLHMHKGPLAAHVVLAHDYLEGDDVAWVDTDLTWTITRGDETIALEHWSQVCELFRGQRNGD